MKLPAQDGIYESVLKSEGVQSNLTRDPEKGAKVWIGDLSRFVTDGVFQSKIDGRDRVVWVGRFIGARPRWLLLKIDGEVFAASGILGPGCLTKDGAVSSRGVDGRYKVSFPVGNVHEAAKLKALLRAQGTPQKQLQGDAVQPATAADSKSGGKQKPKPESEGRSR